jgi:hypothetical protein
MHQNFIVAKMMHSSCYPARLRARVLSDTAELPLWFNGGFWGCFVRMGVESIQPPKPFQAEYEGSIPFTRSKRPAKPIPPNQG